MEKIEIIIKTENIFESIKHVDNNGTEYWLARELMAVLEYAKWGNFKKVIDKAKSACVGASISVIEHFADVGRVLKVGNNADMNIEDIQLSRYACYLIAQNGDPRKKAIALAQTYFAIQTRKQEITEQEYKELSEDERRLYTRLNLKDKNKYLFETAKYAGVKNYGKFNNFGYRGLYNGETAQEIKKRKGINTKEDILDYMGSEELGANLFRITQTEAIIKKKEVSTEKEACSTHHNVGQAVRQTIQKLGGTLPEHLPTPEKSVKILEQEKTKQLKSRNSKSIY